MQSNRRSMTLPRHQWRGSTLRVLLLLTSVLVLGGLAAAPAAIAAPGTVSVSGSTLTVMAPPGAKDNLQITRPSLSRIRVTDFASGPYTGAALDAGAGCLQAGSNRVSCSA